jgi:acyl carrier protein
MKDYAELKEKLTAIFSDHLNIDAPTAETDLLATGMMDSLALVELLVRLEQSFGVQISVDDLELDHFRSIDSIARFVVFHGAMEFAA